MPFRRLAVLVALTLIACDDGLRRAASPSFTLAPSAVDAVEGLESAAAVQWLGARPADARLTWTASPDSVLRVVRATGDEVIVTGRGPGRATLTVRVETGGASVERSAAVQVGAACTVVPPVITPLQRSVSVRGTARFTVVPGGCPGGDPRVDFAVRDSSVASVDSAGTVVGLRAGQTQVVATPRSGPRVPLVALVTVLPSQPPVGWITGTPSALVLADGDTTRLQYVVVLPPNTSAPRTARLVSADTLVATVDVRGLVRAVTPGTTSILIIADADTSFRLAVPVTVDESVPFLRVEPSPVTVARGAAQPLTLTIIRGPNRPAPPGDYTFETRAPAIATVTAAGVIRGVAVGTTSVVVRAAATGQAVRVLQVRVTGP